MTGPEAAGYLAIMLALSVGSIVAVVWATWQLVEPSLWRVVLPLVWLAALRLVLLPGLRRAARPDDLDRRYAALDRDQAAGGRS